MLIANEIVDRLSPHHADTSLFLLPLTQCIEQYPDEDFTVYINLLAVSRTLHRKTLLLANHDHSKYVLIYSLGTGSTKRRCGSLRKTLHGLNHELADALRASFNGSARQRLALEAALAK